MRVYYDERQNAPNQRYSPSAEKPALTVLAWEAAGLAIERRSFEPVTDEQLALAHSTDYVEGVLASQIRNGFGTTCADVARSLPFTVGSMTAAALDAAKNRTFTASPTSGFHHAGYDFGGGFCTFNGLIVAARTVVARGLAERVGILDLDMHYGDGTADIIRRLELDIIEHQTAGAHAWRDPDPEDYFDWIESSLRAMAADGVGVVLAQMGADCASDDPLGGYLSTAGLRRRDALVFGLAAELGLPVAWNLAGGYQRDASGRPTPVLAIHTATAEECLLAQDEGSVQ